MQAVIMVNTHISLLCIPCFDAKIVIEYSGCGYFVCSTMGKKMRLLRNNTHRQGESVRPWSECGL